MQQCLRWPAEGWLQGLRGVDLPRRKSLPIIIIIIILLRLLLLLLLLLLVIVQLDSQIFSMHLFIYSVVNFNAFIYL